MEWGWWKIHLLTDEWREWWRSGGSERSLADANEMIKEYFEYSLNKKYPGYSEQLWRNWQINIFSSFVKGKLQFLIEGVTDRERPATTRYTNSEFFVLLKLDSDQTLLGSSSEYYKLQEFQDYCQNIRSEWASNMRTLSLSFKSWEESLLALNLLLFSIQHFPFLSDLMIKHNSRANFELF